MLPDPTASRTSKLQSRGDIRLDWHHSHKESSFSMLIASKFSQILITRPMLHQQKRGLLLRGQGCVKNPVRIGIGIMRTPFDTKAGGSPGYMSSCVSLAASP